MTYCIIENKTSLTELSFDSISCLMVILFVVFSRQAWQALGDMSQTTAMAEFVKQLDSLCPLFRPFTEAHNAEKQEQARKRYTTKSMPSDFQSFEQIRLQNIYVFIKLSM